MHRKIGHLAASLGGYGVTVENFGLLDNAKTAYAAVPKIVAADLDVLFVDMVTYATSATFGILCRQLNIPIVLVALQPQQAMDYARGTTYMQLCNDDFCSVPEFIGVAIRCGKKPPEIILGTMEDDPVAEASQPRAGPFDRLRVTIEPDDQQVGEPFEHGLAVAAQAERGVDKHRAITLERRREHLDHPVEEDRNVDAHAPPARCTHPTRAAASADDMPKENVSPLLDRRLITGDRMMIAHVYLKKGCIVPKHSHENEQITYIIDGELKFWIGEDESQIVHVKAGEVLTIPSNVPHKAEAIVDTLDVDVFDPPRQDWLDKTDAYLRK